MKHLMKPSRRPLLTIIGASCAATVMGMVACNSATAQAQTTPQQLPSPQLPSTIDENLLAQPALMEQLRSGSLKLEEAWQKGTLNAQNVQALLEGSLGGWTAQDRALRASLAGLLMQHAPQSLAPVDALSRSLKRALADYYANQKDERAIPLYEGLAARAEYSTYEKGLLLETLGYFQRDLNQVKPAMATFMRAREKFVEMKQKHAASGMLIEVARLHGTLGEATKAQALYEQAEREGDGWTTGLSRYEQARVLMKNGKHEAARALLQKPLSGQNAEQIKVGFLSLLAQSYYATGDKANSRRFGEAAIAQYKSLKAPLQGEGLETEVKRARNILSWLERWQKTPLAAEPGEIRLVAGGEPSFALGVRTREAVPLTIISDNAQVTVILIKQAETRAEFYTHQQLLVRVATAAMKPGFKANITLSSEKLPGVKVTVPLLVSELKDNSTTATAGGAKPDEATTAQTPGTGNAVDPAGK